MRAVEPRRKGLRLVEAVKLAIGLYPDLLAGCLRRPGCCASSAGRGCRQGRVLFVELLERSLVAARGGADGDEKGDAIDGC